MQQESSTNSQSSSYTKTILALSLTVWLVVMNTTMFNVALPNVLEQFALQPAQGTWIVSGYSVVLAILTIMYTRLSDYIPIRKLFIIGVLLFGGFSLIGFFTQNFAWLLLARLGQATGAAAIPGLSFVFAGRYIPLERRGRAMAFIASASSLGFGLGPVVGGFITDSLGWTYLFAFTFLVLALIPLHLRLLPREEAKQGTFDLLGGFITGLTVTSFLLFISAGIIYFAIIGIVFAALLWVRITKFHTPFIQPELLKNRSFRIILYMSYLGFTTHFAILVLMPLMLQNVFDKNPTVVGLIIFPGALLSAVAAIFVGRLIDFYGNMKIILLAHVLLTISTILFYFLSPINEYMIMLGYMFTSFGFSSLSSSTTNEVSRILPDHLIGSGMGMKQLTQFIGAASGPVFSGIILELNREPYSVPSFQFAYLFVMVVMVVSFVLYFVYRSIKKQTTTSS
ncbi:tetracycline resistance protein TetA [Pontibacillus halophilus JSM 076056 = DSM 19796]|uniref:Tetracycline resistance protein TetA n=1 Tax=Pontibacillus halophilus JSM 076056 = DSM 19796 TaxID=1385510 RepID=A0A0A5ID28_9BACI|nr:MFS transporter [Pontibacillus halophilus]KGX93747.1 tetracycline resistance protein TetA [Pontibacillus halophilus JSM 076056 = DSM 19796]